MRILAIAAALAAACSSTPVARAPTGPAPAAYAFADPVDPPGLVGWASADTIETARTDAERVLLELREVYRAGMDERPMTFSSFTRDGKAYVEVRIDVEALEEDFAEAHPDPAPKGRTAPDWLDDAQIRSTTDQRWIVRRGAVTGVKNRALARTTATIVPAPRSP